MIYTVTFNPAIDYVVRLDAPLEVGQVNRACGEDCVLGGKGINVSGVLAQLGCPSVALGFVAGETGAWLERGLAAQGLHTDFVHLENGMTRINVKIKAGQETELNGAGPDIPDEALHQLEEKLDGLTENDVLILAGSIPASLPQDVYERLLARLDGRGVRCVVDATRALLVNVLPYHPFLIKPNNHELGEIVGRELHTDEEIAVAARTLQEKGARNVLVSMAGDGALLLDEQGQTHMTLGFTVYGLKKTPQNVLKESANSVIYYGRIIYTSLADLLRGRESINDLSGPVGIVTAIGQAASYGWEDVAELLVRITINLGVFNLLPFPALDGGKIVFLLIEAVTGHAVPEKIQSSLTVAAFALLFGLMLFATYNDIVRLVTGAI